MKGDRTIWRKVAVYDRADRERRDEVRVTMGRGPYRMAMMAAMKNVLSPISDTSIIAKAAPKACRDRTR